MATIYTSYSICESKWCRSRSKRWIDIIAASLGLVLLSPAIFLIALAILVTSGRPVLFEQERLGRYGRKFTLLKFRTMKTAAQRGPGVTCDGDSRITAIGRWLRKRKLDELPQLFNVLKGNMTLVGPRPDLEEFWSQARAEDRSILELTPGVTGASSLAFCDEERLLAQIPRERLTSVYVQQMLPQKARLDGEYAARATFLSDCSILLQTLFVSLLRYRARPTNRNTYRIVHLTSAHPALDGRIFHKECRSLARVGYEVIQVGNYDINGIVDGVRLRGLGSSKGRFQRFTSRLFVICREALRIDGDLYHVHDPDLLIVGLVLRTAGRRVVYDIHEDLPTKILLKMYLPKLIRRPLQWIVERMEGTAAGFMSGLITATPTLKERFIIVHSNTVTVNNFPILEEFSRPLNVDWRSRHRMVTYFGGISEARGVREMLTAMDLLPRTLGMKLELAGWFYVKGLLADLATTPQWQHVTWHGELDRNGLTSLLNRALAGLVILHPEKSFITSQPTKLFEYMAAGIPVIASDFPLWRSIIQEASCGMLVDPFDTQAIAAAIEYLVLNPSEAEEMGQRGRRTVEKRFNWANEEQTLLSFYSSLLPERGVLDAEVLMA